MRVEPGPRDHERDFVDETPDHSSPGSSERISGCSSAPACLAGVAVGRVVTAADVPALQADTQVQPDASFAQAVLTAGHRLRELGDLDRIEVRAGRHVSSMTRRRRSRRVRESAVSVRAGLHFRAGDGGPHGSQGWGRKEGCLGAHAHGPAVPRRGYKAHRARSPGGKPMPRAARRASAQDARRRPACGSPEARRRSAQGTRATAFTCVVRCAAIVKAVAGTTTWPPPGFLRASRPARQPPGASGKTAKCPPRTRLVATGCPAAWRSSRCRLRAARCGSAGWSSRDRPAG